MTCRVNNFGMDRRIAGGSRDNFRRFSRDGGLCRKRQRLTGAVSTALSTGKRGSGSRAGRKKSASEEALRALPTWNELRARGPRNAFPPVEPTAITATRPASRFAISALGFHEMRHLAPTDLRVKFWLSPRSLVQQGLRVKSLPNRAPDSYREIKGPERRCKVDGGAVGIA